MISGAVSGQEIGFQDYSILGCSWLGANCHHTFGNLRRLEATYMQTEQEFNFSKPLEVLASPGLQLEESRHMVQEV